jgi:hypothetical protein
LGQGAHAQAVLRCGWGAQYVFPLDLAKPQKKIQVDELKFNSSCNFRKNAVSRYNAMALGGGVNPFWFSWWFLAIGNQNHYLVGLGAGSHALCAMWIIFISKLKLKVDLKNTRCNFKSTSPLPLLLP